MVKKHNNSQKNYSKTSRNASRLEKFLKNTEQLPNHSNDLEPSEEVEQIKLPFNVAMWVMEYNSIILICVMLNFNLLGL
jgi:hypothetical protein